MLALASNKPCPQEVRNSPSRLKTRTAPSEGLELVCDLDHDLLPPGARVHAIIGIDGEVDYESMWWKHHCPNQTRSLNSGKSAFM